jgi:cold shock CspA family protein
MLDPAAGDEEVTTVILPVQVTFRNVAPEEGLKADIEARARKLETYGGPINSCRVVVEAPARHRAKGYPFHVRIDLAVPGREIVIRRTPTLHSGQQDIGEERGRKKAEPRPELKHLKVAISEAFNAARRQLQDHARQRRADVKTHTPTSQARVTKLLPAAGYGYLETRDGREVYFHKNSVIGNGFQALKLGGKVTFVEESGEKGPQASTVKPVVRAQRISEVLPARQAPSRRKRTEVNDES